MSSTDQTISSPSNFQLIVKALADYADVTGIDLTKNPFAEKLESAISPETILELLQERENAFKQYREGNRRLISCLSPGVKILHAFSRITGPAVSQVSVIYKPMNILTVSPTGPGPTGKGCKGCLHRHRCPARCTCPQNVLQSGAF